MTAAPGWPIGTLVTYWLGSTKTGKVVGSDMNMPIIEWSDGTMGVVHPSNLKKLPKPKIEKKGKRA